MTMTPEQELRGFQVWLRGLSLESTCAACGRALDLGAICRDHSNTCWVVACLCGAAVVRSNPWMMPTPRELTTLLNA